MDAGSITLLVHDRGRELRGVVRPDESWAAAAQRTCASLHTDPVPTDLSGEVKRFVVDHDVTVALRAMTHDDLDDLMAWRSSAAMLRWWSESEVPGAELRSTYGARIDGRSPTRMWTVQINGRAAGFVQDHRLADYPDDAPVGTHPEAIGLDYAIGDDQWRGRGLGQRMLWEWMLRARHRFPDAPAFVAAPDQRNSASLRCLAKAGFSLGRSVEDPQRQDVTLTVCTLDVAAVLG